MPRFQPAARPRFSCSITVASGSCSRTTSALPSLEPLSTTTTSSPRTLSRQRSIHGSALWVTTTTPASSMGRGRPPSAQPLPEQDCPARKRQRDGHEEEEEARGERLVGVDADVAEEADEEGLPHGEAVERERHEQDEEEDRSHHVVDPGREVDPDRPRRRPDREDPHGLDRKGEDEEREQEP